MRVPGKAGQTGTRKGGCVETSLETQQRLVLLSGLFPLETATGMHPCVLLHRFYCPEWRPVWISGTLVHLP